MATMQEILERVTANEKALDKLLAKSVTTEAVVKEFVKFMEKHSKEKKDSKAKKKKDLF